MVTKTRPQGLQEWIAEEIRVLLVRRRMTATQLAGMVGWSSSQISRKLGGQSELTVNDVAKVAKVFQVQPADLLPKPEDGFITLEEWFSRRSLAVAA